MRLSRELERDMLAAGVTCPFDRTYARKAHPRRRDKIPPPSLPLAYPPSIAELLPGLAPTYRAVAERVGVSRQQVTNIIVGRFGVSRNVARRVLELARAA